ncbi:type I polyketide synthase [Nocardia sp. NPDC049149]|uniref:type I polyketide synthase n=1 Tax=Nocardia sp. NPDC049149 TaxID=3364315 RepID=UPI0037153DB6
MNARQDDGVEPIAVVGLAGRFPGAATIDEFWRNQRDGVESVSRFSAQELIDAGWPPQMVAHPDYVPASAVLPGADLFDAEFFGYSAIEAEISDPQQRIFAECAWHALEDTGHDPSRFAGAIGVYAGCFANKYLPLNLSANTKFRQSSLAFSARTYNDKDFLATRAAYLCNLRGPAITVQTACSTSLVAVHLACQALLNYECDMALAGGVALTVPLVSGYPVVAGGLFAPDGHCRPFDAAAGGTVPGYGVAIVALRRLSDALADADHIRALIPGSAVNNDGSAKFGYSAPSVQAQAEVIATAQAVAAVAPETIGYIEAHGTATPFGDPIEVAGLAQAFDTPKRGFCALGSVKANIGHLDAAAGVASLARAVLALEHGEIPPSINFDTPNPALRLDRTPFYVPTTARPWPVGATPRRAGVSSFGIGGTNAHVVLEETPPMRHNTFGGRGAQLLVLSARTEQAVADAASNLAAHLDRNEDLDIVDVCYTLQAGRRRFPLRRHLVCRSRTEAIVALRTLSAEHQELAAEQAAEGAGKHPGGDVDAREVVFLFPGSAARHPDAGAEIYRSEPAFAEQVDRCATLLRPRLGYDVRQLLFPSTWRGPDEIHDDSRGVPAAAFCLQWALAQLWQSWGVRPAAMLGHGDGEYVAACLAGVLDLEAALDITVARADIANPSDAQRAEFATVVARYERKPPQLPYLSGVTGSWISPDEAMDPANWARQLGEPMRLAEGLRELVSGPGRVLLEVGAGNALISAAAAQHSAVERALSSLPPVKTRAESTHLLDTVGALWQAAVEIDWVGFHGSARPRRVPLPGYPFQRRRYWLGPDSGRYEPMGYEETA